MIPLYAAIVKETGLGADGRSIRVVSDIMPLIPDLVYPAFDGPVKLPPPEVDEVVLVFNADSSNTIRWYLPIRTSFGTLTQDGAKLQIECANSVEIEGATIKIGANATESAVLGTTLGNLLQDLFSAILALTVGTSVGPSTTPVNASQFAAIQAQIDTIKSGKVKIE